MRPGSTRHCISQVFVACDQCLFTTVAQEAQDRFDREVDYVTPDFLQVRKSFSTPFAIFRAAACSHPVGCFRRCR